MNKHAVYHEAKSRWAYAADNDTLHIRLRTGRGDVADATLIAADPFLWYLNEKGKYTFDTGSIYKIQMKKEYCDELFDYWFCEVGGNQTLRLRYSFILNGNGEKLRYVPFGFTDTTYETDITGIETWFNFPFLNEEDVCLPPDWAAEAIWYQIFCERFARGGDEQTVPWGTPVNPEPAGHHRAFYGGNLKGIINKLPYIANMGFNGIYFTPLFESPTSHKYDTTDYFKIDPQFGTNEDFRELVKKAHELGIRIMLDAVFNHSGFYHPFFQDVIRKGRNSPYYNYFHILHESLPGIEIRGDSDLISPPSSEQQRDLPYRTFAFVPYMPKWNTAEPGARKYLLSIARFWVEEFDIDGWRFDVSNEVSHDFWREVRSELKKIKPDILLVGENWDDAYPWLSGGQFDSVMNYGLLDAAIGFLRGAFDAAGFAETLTRRVLAAYPKPIQRVLYNMLDCHDTDRLLSECGNNAKAAALGYVIQMTMGGAPSVYYGSEIGMDGYKNGGGNRKPMPWDNFSDTGKEISILLKQLIVLRKNHPSMCAADVEFLNCDGNFLSYRKRADGESLMVLINNSNKECSYALPENDSYNDALSGDCITMLHGTLPPYGFLLLLSR